jgi:uncharacterized protein YtpQ (UPF0354 family)
MMLLVFVIGVIAVGISLNRLKGIFQKNMWEAKSLSPEEFTKLYTSLLQEMTPGYTTEIVAPLELQTKMPDKDNTFKSFLDNVYKESQFIPEKRKETCVYYIKIFIESLSVNGENHAIDPNKIIPIIKDISYINNLSLDINSEKPLVYENLTGDIFVTYAIQEEGYIHFLSPSEFKALNISLEQLRTLAKENLHKKLPEIKVVRYENCHIIEADYQNDASLLLFDSIWQQMEQKVGGQIIAATPNRSMLIFTTKETDGGITKLKEIIRKVSENEPYLISETLLIRQNGKWEVFEE